MSNNFLEEHKSAKELLLKNLPFEFNDYLDKRRPYKEDTFNEKEVSSHSGLYEEFKNIVNQLNEEDLKQFILITSIQDIVVFDQVMIDKIKILPKGKPVSVQNFIKNKLSEFEVLLNDNYVNLPEYVQVYIIKNRFQYKQNLYINSKVSVKNFHDINNTYDSLISNLDENIKKSPTLIRRSEIP
ncbi:11463_t:CDS:2, partial [Racocetra fulgida]